MPFEETYKVGGNDETVEQNKPSYVMPNFYAVYSFGQTGPGKFAAYAYTGVVAGGGYLDWKDGTLGSFIAGSAIGAGDPVLSSSVQASSAYLHTTIGAAYSLFNDFVSASLSGRVVYAMRSLKVNVEYSTGNLTADYDYNAVGYTPVIGINIKPISGLSISMRYEFETSLEFEYNEKTLNGVHQGNAAGFLQSVKIADGEKFNYNLPAMLALGVEYTVIPQLKVMMDVNIYFLSQADLGNVYQGGTGTYLGKLNDYFKTGYEITFGATYMLLKDFKIGAGFNYAESGAKDKYFEDSNTVLICSANPPIDSFALALGGTYIVDNNLDLTLAGSWTHFLPYKAEIDATALGFGIIDVDYKKNIYVIAIGAGYKM